jgi:hypothetical protein
MENKDILIVLLNQPATGGYLFHNQNMYCHVKAAMTFIDWVYLYQFSDVHLERIAQGIKDDSLSDFYFIPKNSIFNSKVMLI